MKPEDFTATPVDIPVTWARHPDDTGWRTSGVDRFLRWDGGSWCARRPRAMLTEYLDPVQPVVEHRGRLLGVHPDGYGLVMEDTRMLTLIPLGALRAELP